MQYWEIRAYIFILFVTLIAIYIVLDLIERSKMRRGKCKRKR